ncbi:MAG: LysM peptidoglycan-binding domain-containing protein [Deltaproteobacteria bacterium]
MPYNFYRECPVNHYSYTVKPGDTLYKIALTYHVSLASILHANPSINPNYITIGQHLCIPRVCPPTFDEIITAMQGDINMLIAESSGQSIQESNYGNSTKRTRVLRVTNNEIQFDAAPVAFPGNYTGYYTAGLSYPYYSESASGGQRGITVKDNFGVWHIFGYHIPVT